MRPSSPSVAGHATESAELKRIAAPLMGVALLVALGWLGSAALRSTPSDDDVSAA